MTTPHGFALYASVGDELIRYEIDVTNAQLTRRESIQLPGNVQYLWPHPNRGFFYVSSTDGGSGSSGIKGTIHRLTALKVDPTQGQLSLHGAQQALPSRPIHNTVDATGRFALTAYNNPSHITVHRILADGSVGEMVASEDKMDTGVFAHQVLMTPGNRSALLVTRGNNASSEKAEEAGALKFYHFNEGRLSSKASLHPGHSGLGYGPRHVDFHPTKPWMYASIERQNTLHMHTLENDQVSKEPLFIKDTLSGPFHNIPRQMCSAIHVHPNGRFVYLANRADNTIESNGRKVFDKGENTLVVFSINPSTGEPTVIQHVESHLIHVRNFSFDPSGQLMVASSTSGIDVLENGSIRHKSAGLSVFRVAEDGKLSFVRQYDIDTPGIKSQFWSGIMTY